MRLSVIIPTWNEAEQLPRLLAALQDCEVIVADGGSTDGTREVARARGARVVESVRGRGAQLAAGADAATGDVLWFLHADTLPPPEALAAMAPHYGAGNFALRFDGESTGARWLTWLYPRLRPLGLIYGDSGIFVRRDLYRQAGGFAPHPVFEDLDLVRRLRRLTPWVHLEAELVTSSRRFEHRFGRQFAHWVLLQALYWLGVPPSWLAPKQVIR
ncbi:MAG: TIGR04283 family arsenosugar biosynthesis glycosyltransferase [Bryobacteraceae bacterium]|nr:TIGR04283 family arsenosugar biosynthesis glycosyltransferase [Bryobacteraceae bacterium]